MTSSNRIMSPVLSTDLKAVADTFFKDFLTREATVI